MGAVVVIFILTLAKVQLASDALTASAAASGTFPTRVPASFGRLVYAWLDRIAPAPYVETTLAQDALARGDANAAEHYALRLPASPVRDELLARVAQTRGAKLLALEYFLAAPDAGAVNAAADDLLAARNPAAAYRLESLLETRLAMLHTHPDAVAEAYWRMGRYANQMAFVQISGSPAQNAWLRRGRTALEAAAALSPLSERYAIEAANQSDLLGDRVRASQLFAQALAIDPASADALAGLGVIAFQTGDREGAARYLTRARALDPQSLMVRALERDLR
ncbi:MAG TPA: tetratricopeptide repeat protein [Candidatus Cybelea sp.]